MESRIHFYQVCLIYHQQTTDNLIFLVHIWFHVLQMGYFYVLNMHAESVLLGLF